MATLYRNISFATADNLALLMTSGTDVLVRGNATKELLNRVTILERPAERFLFLPGRRHNVFAQIAETMWVIAGRNDVEWLERYLHRAREFSDDGKTWRAGYGPRLRRWSSIVDQLAEVTRLLREDRSTRRAVMSLFDPSVDFVESKDIPCNNWLSWIIRDGKLHLSVAVRSNDAMWGFSGVNAFEWSVLHEMMALWSGAEIGTATYFATSFHLYEMHYERAKAIAARFYGISPYDFGVARLAFVTPRGQLDDALRNWFELEERIRQDPDDPVFHTRAFADPFLEGCLQIVRLKWGSLRWDDNKLAAELSRLPESDGLTAAYEHLGRQRPAVLENITHPSIAAFFEACRRPINRTDSAFRGAVKKLHTRKDRAYGASWKRRGERTSILPNIARKIDRLEVFIQAQETSSDESILDTAVDLYVYVAKYLLFLEEGTASSLLPHDAATPYSDYDANFDYLIDRGDFHRPDGSLRENIERAVQIFASIWPYAEAGAPRDERRRLATDLEKAARGIISALIAGNPDLADAFVRSESLLRSRLKEHKVEG